MTKAKSFLLMLPLLLLVSSCTAGSATRSSEGPRRSSNFLVREEIADSNQTDAFSMVQMLRPRWLNTRGSVSFTQGGEAYVRVYMDGIPIGGPDALKNIVPANIASLEYLDSRSATQRYGTNHPHGAILVKSGR